MIKQALGVLAASVVGVSLSMAVFYHASAQPAGARPAPAPAAAASGPASQGSGDFAQAKQAFSRTCGGCHGPAALGGDRGPALIGNADLRKLDAAGIGAIITGGTPRGMPAFSSLPADQVASIAAWLKSENQNTASVGTPAQVAAGESFFFGDGKCASCHMVHGKGSNNGPDLSTVGQRLTPAEITAMLDDPTAQMGTKRTPACPGWAFCPNLEWNVANVTLKSGGKLRGFLRTEGDHSITVQTFDGRAHMLSDKEFASYTREDTSYMPPLKATADQRRDLMAYLATLSGAPPLGPLASAKGFDPKDMDAVIHPRPGEWPSYNGGPNANRYSPLDQINASNASRLKAAWIFTPGGTGLETTPVVIDGIMYVTGAQQLCALDPRTGLSLWCVPRSAGQAMRAGDVPQRPTRAAAGGVTVSRPFGGVASGNGPNRGVAVLGDRVYFESDDAYMVCLDRLTGGVVWTVPMTDPKFPGLVYATMAPMIVGDLIIGGVSADNAGPRGFIAAFKASTGELAWRFFTIPLPGEPTSETWVGNALATGGTGGAGAWMTGSYDPVADILYWGTANPDPSNDGDERQGRNLYANSILALDPKTGKLKWFYQTTPHDVHDWDATAPLVLVDTEYQGKPRKLLLQANRNGYFYALDRITGELLTAEPFVKKTNWASGIGPDGMPVLNPDYAPTDEGHLKCPAVRGATNWFATSYNPGSKLFYVMAAEDCGYFRKTGRVYSPNPDFKDPGKRFLRALDINTAKTVWEKPLVGSHEANYGGVLSTAGNLVFHGETAGGFAAVDARTGKTLWSFPTNDSWRASPMTYTVDGKQYVAVAAGTNVIAFTLGD
jgi:PQQ-dependent dehydrogenase (methanol/ethanol family)